MQEKDKSTRMMEFRLNPTAPINTFTRIYISNTFSPDSLMYLLSKRRNKNLSQHRDAQLSLRALEVNMHITCSQAESFNISADTPRGILINVRSTAVVIRTANTAQSESVV